jgi:cytosine/adenosine deaminase-related metal-dependent hydrolase
MEYVKGDILTTEGFKKGYLSHEIGKKTEIRKGLPPKKPVATGLIVPTFVNAHTHLGDSFIRNKNLELPRNVGELVAPPNGLKHRLLKKASEIELINGINESIKIMKDTGTSHFIDFREEGIKGIFQLQKAMKSKRINSMILSRPLELKYDKNEINLLLEKSDGIGLSSVSDWEYSEIQKISKHTKKEGKIFALHASEVEREDINLILDLHPDFLIHMISATEADLYTVKDEEIPIVICPRSNSFFKLKINLELLKKTEVSVLLGTDNAMLNPPNIIEEVKHLKKLSSVFSTEELLNMVTYTPRKVLNLVDCINGPNLSGSFVVLDRDSLKPKYILK